MSKKKSAIEVKEEVNLQARYARVCERIEVLSDMTEETIWHILKAHHDKGLTVEDLQHVFCLPLVVVQLIIAEYEAEHESKFEIIEGYF